MTGLQQTLDFTTKSQPTFNNFLCKTNNNEKEMLMFFIRNPHENSLLMTGEDGVGKSHLLRAACQLYQESGHKAAYISFNQPTHIEQLFHRRLHGELICIDDISLSDSIPELENLLFRLFNHAETEHCKMIWAINQNTTFSRKDLQSRAQSMLKINLKIYNNDELFEIMKHHLQETQSIIPDEVCRLLIQKYSCSPNKLINKAKEIEQYACSVQKKLSLKMAREMIKRDFHQLGEQA